MSSIDSRIVQMQFDNDQFQRGVSQTVSSLGTLENGLKLDGATSGLNNIRSAADSMNLSSVADGVSHISSAFSALGVMGITILSNLTTEALNLGKSVAGQVLDPILQGGQQRAIALQQAKFQFQGLGLNITTTMAAALAAVKGTAFGLGDAATAAAQFGASGITAGHGLESTLRAVSGVAAQTNSDYSSIAQIFEKVSGNGRLMGEDLLQLSAHGVNAAATIGKSMGKTEAQVRQMVTDGKISFQQFSDAMNGAFGANATKANQTFTGALANARTALSRLGEAFDTPKIVAQGIALNAITPVIDSITKALTPLIVAMGAFMKLNANKLAASLAKLNFSNLNQLGSGLAAAFKNVTAALSTVIAPLKAAFAEIFPPQTSAQIAAISLAIQKFTAGLILTKQAQADLKNTFAGFFAIIDIGMTIIGKLVKVIGDLFGASTGGSNGLLSVTGAIGAFLVKVDAAVQHGTGLNTFFKGFETVLLVPINIVKTLTGALGLLISTIEGLGSQKSLDAFAADTAQRFSGLIAIGNFLQSVWRGIEKVAGVAMAILQPILVVLGHIIQDIANSVGKALGSLNFTQATQALNTGLFAGFLFILNGFFGGLKGAIAGNGIAIVSSFKKVFGQLQLNLKALEMNTNAKTIFTIAAAVALLAVSAVALSLVNPGKLGIAMSAITVGLGDLLAAFALMQKIPTSKGFLETASITVTIVLLAGAIDLLTIALVALSFISWDGLAKGLSAVTVLLGEMVVVSNLLKGSGPGLIITAAAIVILAASMSVMAGAIAIFAALSWESLGKGLAAVTALLGEMVGTVKLLSGTGPGVAIAAASILTISVALSILGGAVAIFAALSWESLGKGLASVTVLLIELVSTLKILSGSGPGVLIAAAALLIMAVALSAMTGAVAILGAMSLGNLTKGLVALALTLVVVVAALKILADPMVLVGAAAMVVAAAAILIMSGAMAVFGAMSWDAIGRAITVLAASLIILAVVMTAMGDPLVLLGAAGLIVAAASLSVLAPAMVLLGTISWDAIGRGLTVLAAAIVILALGGVLLIPAIPGLLGLGIAIALLGIGALAAGIGLALLATGMTALVAIGGAAFGVMTTIIQAFIAQLPAMAIGFANALGVFATEIATKGPQMVAALTAVLMSLIIAFGRVQGPLIVTIIAFIRSLVNAVVVLVPLFVDGGMKIILGILTGISNNIGKIVTKGLQIVTNFINGVAQGLPGLANAAANLVVKFINSVADAIDSHKTQLRAATGHLSDSIVDGLTGGLSSRVGDVVAAAAKLANAIPGAIKSLLHIASPSKITTELGEWTGMGMAVGLNNMASTVTDAATGVGQNAVTALSASISGISDAVNSNMDIQPTIAPVMDLTHIKSGNAQIGSMLASQTLSVGTLTANAAQVNAGVAATQAPTSTADTTLDANGNPVSAANAGVTFNQYNNSPTALSTADIYRQTKNSISIAREALSI